MKGKVGKLNLKMLFLKNIRNTLPPIKLTKLNSTAYDLVWIEDYFDAPLSGLLEIKNELFWFDCINENKQPNEWFRQYAIVKLSKKELRYLTIKHREFQKHVGTHWDRKYLTKPPNRVFGQEGKFYDKYLTVKENYENNEVIGWFEI